MSHPLAEVRVLELTNFIAGPFCGCQLADLGADVIKIETPGAGDHARRNPPIVAGDGAAFFALNRGKRSVALDLKDRRGRAAFLRLVETADVLIENMRPGAMADLGIDAETVRSINPRLIYCSISGFGQTGPWSSRAGLDLIAQAASGIMSITGEPGGAPVKCGIPVADLATALYGALAITAALRARDETGVGQTIDLSLFESALALGVWETAQYFATGEVAEPLGSGHRSSAPYQAFRCVDGYITLGAVTPASWHGVCVALGEEHLEKDSRFDTVVKRKSRERELAEILEAVTITMPRDHWQTRLGEAGVPSGPIYRYDEALATDHVRERGMVATVDHPRAGEVRMVASPIHFGGTPTRRPAAAPILGQHGHEVFQEIGMSDGDIAALVSAGVLVVPG
ncbi:MAG: CoA transferase [Chloroflexota bacterium]|nr:MAG: CoA transferase [Chloroflexota bacterium]